MDTEICSVAFGTAAETSGFSGPNARNWQPSNAAGKISLLPECRMLAGKGIAAIFQRKAVPGEEKEYRKSLLSSAKMKYAFPQFSPPTQQESLYPVVEPVHRTRDGIG
jgi:hypothetical protein